MVANIEKDLEVEITYKYYEIAVNQETIDSVNTMEEAEELVKQIKDEKEEKEIDLSIIEKYTEKEEDIKTKDLEVAKKDIETKIEQTINEQQKQKKEEERTNGMPEINGIKLACKPVSGTISSRYGVSSSIRSSNHTGLDIATASGTPIKVVAAGTVTHASYKGSYGNLVVISHGNGVETYYAHCSRIYASPGDTVSQGTVIAAVGSTGNSTGPHLHFGLYRNNVPINPLSSVKAVSKELQGKEKEAFLALTEHFMPHLQDALNKSVNAITLSEGNLPDKHSQINAESNTQNAPIQPTTPSSINKQ